MLKYSTNIYKKIHTVQEKSKKSEQKCYFFHFTSV